MVQYIIAHLIYSEISNFAAVFPPQKKKNMFSCSASVGSLVFKCLILRAFFKLMIFYINVLNVVSSSKGLASPLAPPAGVLFVLQPLSLGGFGVDL